MARIVAALLSVRGSAALGSEDMSRDGGHVVTEPPGKGDAPVTDAARWFASRSKGFKGGDCHEGLYSRETREQPVC